jgi:hypothetical protein
MRIIVFVLFLLPLVSYAQSNMTVKEIEQDLIRVIQDTSSYERRTIVSITGDGEIDTIRFYFTAGKLRFVYHYRFKGAYSYGEGPPYADIHSYKKLLFINGRLKYLKINTITEYYLDYKKGEKTNAEDEILFLSESGRCLKYFIPRKVEGNSLDAETKLEKMPLIEENCIYCPYNKDIAKKYLEIL